MAYVRNNRGTKSQFNSAKIANRISQTYHSVMGERISIYRKQIQTHAQRINLKLRSEFGDGNDVEWTRQNISKAIAEELRLYSPAVVFTRYMEEERKTIEGTGKGKKNQDYSEVSDPVWTVHSYRKLDLGNEETIAPSQNDNLFDFGLEAKKKKSSKTQSFTVDDSTPTKRTDWIQMFQSLAVRTNEAFDFSQFKEQILDLPATMRHQDHESWWKFWQQQFDLAMQKDPRVVHLMRTVLERRERTLLVDQQWLAGTQLTPKIPMYVPTTVAGEESYQQLWLEHIQFISESSSGNPEFLKFDLKKLAARLKSKRDLLVDWRGMQWLSLSDSLWKLKIPQWELFPTRKPNPEAHEPVQWAFMRTAMGLALNEKNPTNAAIQFYEEFSNLRVIPSATMMREAGKLNPKYLEDEAGSIKDEYESIYEAIHRSAVRTKWTGTITLDWRNLRAKGASIAGRRVSQGPVKFMESINTMLESQGRQDDNKPVTVILPLWHRDIEALLDDHWNPERLQCVISIPDMFFEHLNKNKPWILVDPVSYPEILSKNYSDIELKWNEKKQKPDHTIKSIASEKIWRKMLECMSKGKIFVLFEDSDLSFTPFPESAPAIGGIDGVGAIPIPKNLEHPYTSWPSAAVNLSKIVDNDGQPDAEIMAKMANVAMRILDNSIELSNLEEDDATLLYRPVCLGAVGFFEAVNKGIANNQLDRQLIVSWAAGLSEAWARTVLSADQKLKEERGAAPAFSFSQDARPYDPIGSMERLKQSRDGSIGHRPKPNMKWSKDSYSSHRFSTRMVWAPYIGSSKIAGVTPGGIGTLRPVESILDEEGKNRLCPTPLLLEMIKERPEDIEDFGKVMQYPENHRKWPAVINQLSFPTAEGWENRLAHAAHIRPWVDQGISLTLPAGLSTERLAGLVQKSWWLGLSNIRFEGFYIENNENSDEINPENDIDKMTK